MAVTAEERANLAKRIADAGGDPKEAAKFAGAPEAAAESTGATQTPPEQAATPPQPQAKAPRFTGKSISTTKSQRIIFGVVLFATAMTIIGDVLAGRTSVTDAVPRRVAAGTIAGVMLMLLAIPLPKLAASLAGVIGVASLFVNPNGQKVLEAISKIGGSGSGERSRGGGRRTGNAPDTNAPPPIVPGQPS